MWMIYIGSIVPASILLPFIAALTVRNKRFMPGFLILFIYLCTQAAASILSILLIKIKLTNIPLLHVDTLLEVVLLVLYLDKAIEDKALSKYSRFIIVAFSLLCIFNFIFFQSIYSFNTYTRPAGAIVLIVLCMYYRVQHIKKNEEQSWSANPHNWFVTGILLYFSCSLLLFICSNYLAIHTSRESNMLIWTLHATFLLIMYLLFTKGFLHANR